jgi:hypothetical protein
MFLCFFQRVTIFYFLYLPPTIAQFFIMELIPDTPEAVEIQLARQEFICRKLIDRVADDDDKDVEGADAPLQILEYPR